MIKEAILAVDEGTTNSKAILIDQTGQTLSTGSAFVKTNYPQPSWVEQSASQIWSSTLAAINDCLTKKPLVKVVALGISNQRESILLWNKRTGKPIGPVVNWQCRRTAAECNFLKEKGLEKDLIHLTGLPVDPLFSSTKIKWLIDNYALNVPEEEICVGTVDSWLIWNFSGGQVHGTDRSNASRTQLFNISNGCWDQKLCDLFQVSMDMLPTVNDSSYYFGETKNVPGLSDGIPIASSIGDSHGALFGHTAFQVGDGKVTFGTGSSLMITLPNFTVPPKGLTTTIAWSLNGRSTFAIEGNIFVSASLLPWVAEMLGIQSVEALISLAQTVNTTDGVVLVPAHVGLGAPHWDSNARGLISGLTFNTKPAHIALAALDSVALQVQDIFNIVASHTETAIKNIYVDGGASRNDFIMSLVADYLNHPVIKCTSAEASARGAAFLAGLAVSFWPDLEDLSQLQSSGPTIKPKISSSIRRNILNNWRVAIQRTTLNVS